MSDLFTEQLALFTEECAAWNASDGNSRYAAGSESSVIAPSERSRADVFVQWWLGVISFIGTSATGIGVTEALHYLWEMISPRSETSRMSKR